MIALIVGLAFWTTGWIYFLHLTWDRKAVLEACGGYWVPACLFFFAWPWGIQDYITSLKRELENANECRGIELAMRLEAEARIMALEEVEEAYLNLTKPELALVPKEDY